MESLVVPLLQYSIVFLKSIKAIFLHDKCILCGVRKRNEMEAVILGLLYCSFFHKSYYFSFKYKTLNYLQQSLKCACQLNLIAINHNECSRLNDA